MQKSNLSNQEGVELSRALELARKRQPPSYGTNVDVPRISAIFAQDLAEAFLFTFGARGLVWRDRRGETRRFTNVLVSLLRMSVDGLFWPLFYLKHLFSAWRLSSYKAAKAASLKSVVYLRSDHVFDSESGGAIAHIGGVANAMIDANLKVSMLSTDRIPAMDSRVNFTEVRPCYGVGRNIPNMPALEYTDQMYFEASQLFNMQRPDFIYQRYSLGNYTGVLLKHQFKIPFVCEFNGPLLWIEREWGGRPKIHEGLLQHIEDMNVKAADLVVVVSEALADILDKKGVPRERILVNPNGVDVNTFNPGLNGDDVRHRYSLEGKCVIGFIGSFGAWHGAEVLAEAFGFLSEAGHLDNDNVRLLLIGNGNTAPDVRVQLEKFGTMGKAVLTGTIPQDQAAEHLAACDILVSPHIPNKDGSPFFGSPTKLFEYMAMGRGIVASDLDQIGEILTHERSAILVQPNDPRDLAKGLLRLIKDDKLRESLGRAARKDVVEKYTWQLHVQRILNALYKCGFVGSSDLKEHRVVD